MTSDEPARLDRFRISAKEGQCPPGDQIFISDDLITSLPLPANISLLLPPVTMPEEDAIDDAVLVDSGSPPPP
jgi:hypothetical protein